MIKSMTAFARGTAVEATVTVEMTVRSYNSKNLDFSIFLPEACQPFEDLVKKTMARFHTRGRIEIRLTLADAAEDQDLFEVDLVKARAYVRALKTLQEGLGMETPIAMETVLGAKQVIVAGKPKMDEALLARVIERAALAAAQELGAMRAQEGENLFADLSARLTWVEAQMEQVAALAKSIPETYRLRLQERLAVLTQEGDPIDPVRLAQEVAILADKSDVSEEIVRVQSHVKLFREAMKATESQGRKLNFLIQEFNREFNTIGSKAGSTELSHLVVDLKSELEKIREQVQNIE